MSCPDCAAGKALPGEPTGELSTEGAYLSRVFGSGRPSESAIVLLTDVFGLPLKNTKIIADRLSKELGCDVWVPDYFAGWPILPLSRLKDIDHTGGLPSTWDWIRFYWSMIPRIPAFISSRPAVVDQRIAKFISMILQERKYKNIGAVGYCYGGSAAIRLGATDLVNSIVVCHPGPFTTAQAKAIKTPAAWVCAEGAVIEDVFLAGSHLSETEAVFAQRTIHGFAIRPNLSKPGDQEAYEKSLEQITTWFSKTLLV